MDRFTPSVDRRAKMATGQELLKRWGIVARQARFHHQSNWYEPPTKFPAALCDREGYVVFETERQLKDCSGVHVGKKINVRGGIWAIPGYRKVDDPVR
jgi:hypothetical protein